MKKLSLLLTLFVLALSFTSCDKEGVYNPNKKISKSYLDTGEGKQLTSTWNWDGKLLRTIDYHDLISGEIAYTNIFSYNDKNQIVSISDITNNLTTKYFYYGNRFDKIVSYYNDEVTETYFFEYDDNKISEIKVVENGLFKNTNNTLNPLKAGAITSLTLPTALRTPLPKYLSVSPSLSSRASLLPVEAPEGTDASALMPHSKITSAATVGVPRESSISRAFISLIFILYQYLKMQMLYQLLKHQYLLLLLKLP